MAPFGGFDMPIQYEGIIAEHFHPGNLLRYSTPAIWANSLSRAQGCGLTWTESYVPVASMQIGQCRYGFICNEEGGVLDDQIVYRMSSGEFFMVSMLEHQDADFEWN